VVRLINYLFVLLATLLWGDNIFARTLNEVSPTKILIIGNSIIYVNNLPATLSSLLPPGSTVDMFAKGGGSVTDMAYSKNLRIALARTKYQVVFIQEQGGSDLCLAFDKPKTGKPCESSVDAHIYLSNMVKKGGSMPYYMGTYQTDPQMSQLLVDSERFMAKTMGSPYLEMSNNLLRLRTDHPQYKWFNTSDLHPGYALTTLMAIEMYKALYHRYPKPINICDSYIRYNPKDKFNGFVDSAALLRHGLKSQCVATKDEMKTMINDLIRSN